MTNLPEPTQHDGEVHQTPLYPLEPHHLRMTDTDPKAAKRAERQVATMFSLSAVLVVAFVVVFFAVDPYATVSFGPAGTFSVMNLLLGVTFGGAVFLIGAGAIHWAKKLMVEEEMVDHRHSAATPQDVRDAALEDFDAGVAESGFTQRKLVRRTLLGSLVLFPVPLIVMLKELGPPPEQSLEHTIWTKDERIVVDVLLRPVRPEDVPIGGLVNAQPESLAEVQHADGNQNARAKASIILVRMRPEEIRSQQGEGWDYDGILAFSKICTHVGCPIALYQQRTHHLLCPCHQSTFDLSDSGSVVFGPAGRRLPQLPITIDSEGYLVAQSDFHEPVGPAFWELGAQS